MAHFTSIESPPEEPDESSARNARYGMALFAIYLAFYAGFVLLVAFASEWMQAEVAGVNLAILYGLGLIVGAFALAAVYLWLCKKPSSI